MILTTKIDTAVRFTKRADWLGDRFKEREIANAICKETASYGIDVAAIMELIKAQKIPLKYGGDDWQTSCES